ARVPKQVKAFIPPPPSPRAPRLPTPTPVLDTAVPLVGAPAPRTPLSAGASMPKVSDQIARQPQNAKAFIPPAPAPATPRVPASTPVLDTAAVPIVSAQPRSPSSAVASMPVVSERIARQPQNAKAFAPPPPPAQTPRAPTPTPVLDTAA